MSKEVDRYSPDPEKRFEDTPHERPPRKGEWYMGVLRLPVLALRDFSIRSLPILKRVDDGPRCEEEIEREWLDAQEKAAERKAAAEEGPPPPVPPMAPLRPPRLQRGPKNAGFKQIATEYRLPYAD